jgi:uncharacterized protein YbjT (DUF2867 family)
MDDASSLVNAFRGADMAFAVTNYWEHLSPEKELSQASALASAAKSANLNHIIWSTLEDTRKWIPLESDQMPTLLEKYKVPHFDAKGEANAFFTESGVPVTLMNTSFYWDNFIHFGMGPQPGPDGVLGITFPMGDKKLPGIAAVDIGKCAFGVFQNGAYRGKTIGIAGEHVTGAEMAAGFTKALGKEVRYNDVPPEVYRSFGFPGADDLGNMFQFKRDFNDEYCAARSVELSRALNPELQSFEQWLTANKGAIKL